MGNKEERCIIELKITNENQITNSYKCDTKELLETLINRFAQDIQVTYSSPFVLYNGESISGKELKTPLSEIIKPHDKEEKKMILLLYENTEIDTNIKNAINIVLLIESVKKFELKGIKEETLKNIIRDSSAIKLDLKWCIFKYKENTIDINKKFDDIANDEDKKKLKLILTVNYTIPLIVNFVDKNNKNLSIIECKLNDWVDIYFTKNYLDKEDYDLYFENKKLENYKIFYELLMEDKIQNYYINENLNNTKNNITATNEMNKTNTNTTYEKEKIFDIPLTVFPKNETENRKLEIEIKVILKCCIFRYKKKLLNCCEKFSGKCKRCTEGFVGVFLGIILGIIMIAVGLFVMGGWIVLLLLL